MLMEKTVRLKIRMQYHANVFVTITNCLILCTVTIIILTILYLNDPKQYYSQLFTSNRFETSLEMQVESIPKTYQFGEETTGLRSLNEFPTKIVQQVLNIIKNEGFLNYEVHSQAISTNGGNYLGDLCSVDIKGNTKNGEKTINLFLKIVKGEDTATLISMNDMYQTELFAYNELSKILAELQEDANVPLPERYTMVKCYEGSNNQVIILENLSKKGYLTPNRMEVISLQFGEMAIKELAKFHALSFAMQAKRPDYFNKKIKTIKHHLVSRDAWNGLTESMYHNVLVKYVDEDMMDRVENAYFKETAKHFDFLNDKTTQVCLCHGDFRPNNMMYKITDGTVTDVIPVDYQGIFYRCPMYDIMYFIFTATDREFRKAHLSHLKELYHNTLGQFLDYFNIDVEVVYPREMFEKMFKKRLNYGLIIGFTILPFILVSEDDVPDMTNDTTEMRFEVDDIYKERLRGIIDDFIDWGYL